MSTDKPCADCGPTESYSRAEKLLAVVGLFAGTVIGYMAVDIMTGGELTRMLGRLFGRGGIAEGAETYLKTGAAHDR